MKVLYIESTKKENDPINIDPSLLPKKLLLAYSIQYKKIAEKIGKELETRGIKILGFRQVLGCSKLLSKSPILLIGSGKFHALNLALQNKEVYVYDGKIKRIDEKEVEILKLRKKNLLNKLIQAKKIGIIISTKPGQERSKEAKALVSRLRERYKEKEVFSFVSSNINTNEFENFQIDLWINSACPGLINDSDKIINIDDIFDFLEEKQFDLNPPKSL